MNLRSLLVEHPKRLAAALGSGAFLAVFLSLYAPGITIDEPLDVRPGRIYLETLLRRGLGFFDRPTIDRVFRDNAEHPPLGRWLLGVASRLGEPAEILIRGPDPLGTYVRSARLAPAVCFGWLVYLITSFSMRHHGQTAGVVSALSLVLMPRVFAHAHLAALDLFVACFWSWALLAAIESLHSTQPIRRCLHAGVIFSLALLTKIHGWLLIPVVSLWVIGLLLHPAAARSLPASRRRILIAWILWLFLGIALFVAGWPWLWSDLPDRLLGYFRTGVDRLPIRVLYFGCVYLDHELPWHYPWLFFAVTVPVFLHVVGFLGAALALRRAGREPIGLLLLIVVLGWLLLFSTSVAVYDGERLFLPAFAVWAIFIGRGAGALWEWLKDRHDMFRWVFVLLLLSQVQGLVRVFPYGLSYYNILVGGLPGAERLGLELTTWTDCVDDQMLNSLALAVRPGDPAALVPTLAPQQGLWLTTLPLARRNVHLADQEALSRARWVVIHRRQAYWPDNVPSIVASQPYFLSTRQGVWLAGIWELSVSNQTETGNFLKELKEQESLPTILSEQNEKDRR